MKNFCSLAVLLICTLLSSAQNEDAAGSIALTPVNMIGYSTTQWGTSQCGTTTYNLGNSNSPQAAQAISGLMNNDVWFHFVAPAEVVKIKVCNPVTTIPGDPTFDVSIELWNATATGTAIAALNNAGSGQKETLCSSSLIVGQTYKVRVGRANGTAAGTFNIICEYFGVNVRNTYSPDPPGSEVCYDFVTGIQRTYPTFSVGSTRWKFVAIDGTVFGPYTGSYQIFLNEATGLCETLDSLHVYVEIQATDIDCGNIWWGNSIMKPIKVCANICPSVQLSSPTTACGGIMCNIFYRTFSTGNIGSGFLYQFRFITDSGQTEFTSAWSSSPFFSTSTSPYIDYFRYGRVYQVYVRVKRCNANPLWCGPCTFTTCGFPSANIAINNDVGVSNYCLWRNKTGSTIAAVGIVGMDQYRFRLTPVDPCSSNPYTPIGSAITTGWSSSLFITPSWINIPLNQVYMIQVQCRVLPASYTNSSGQTGTIPGQQSDWGWPCFVGMRNNTSPAAGSTISCCNFPLPTATMLPDDFYFGESKWTEFTEWTDEPEPIIQPGSITIMKADGNEIQMDLSESSLFGTGQCDIYAISGKLMESHQLQAVHENNFVSITTKEELPSGIYLVSVYTPTGKVSQKFFVSNQ